MGRRKVRDTAFKCLYQIQLGISREDVINGMFKEDEENKLNEIKDEVVEIIDGVLAKEEDITLEIKNNLKKWTIERLPKVDTAILKLAIYEIKYLENVPYKVAVNEAIELAKMYSTDESPAFINGLLSKIKE